MGKNPVLSICIPTYNRGNILKDVIDRYVSCAEFDDEVELVISDNCSTDETETICREYSEKYSNIVYNRNIENIHDANFVKVLDIANGDYLKLFNDWVFCTNESLRFLKQKVRENANNKPPLFFTSGHIFTKYKSDVIKGIGLDDYVSIVSTFVTYNNLFGVWKEHWHEIIDKRRYAALQLQQEDWSFQIVRNHPNFIVYDTPVFYASQIPLGKRGGYNWFNVHLDNYYLIMGDYIKKSQISAEIFRQDRKNYLEHFKYELSLAIFYNYSKEWRFETRGTLRLLWKYFKRDSFFYVFMMGIFPYYIYRWLRQL